METLCRDCGNQPSPEAETCLACGSARIVRTRSFIVSPSPISTATLSTPPSRNATGRSAGPSGGRRRAPPGRRGRVLLHRPCPGRALGHADVQGLKACPDATVIKPDMKKYAAVGREVRAMMRNLTPLVEPLSIDEAFMDLAGTEALHRGQPGDKL